MFPVMFYISSLHGAKIPRLALGSLPVHSSLCPSGQSLTQQDPVDGWSLGFRSRLALRPAELSCIGLATQLCGLGTQKPALWIQNSGSTREEALQRYYTIAEITPLIYAFKGDVSIILTFL